MHRGLHQVLGAAASNNGELPVLSMALGPAYLSLPGSRAVHVTSPIDFIGQ